MMELMLIIYLEFQYEECHFKVMNSPQYQNIMQELERLTPEQRLTNDHKRFVNFSLLFQISFSNLILILISFYFQKCVMEVLGLK